MKTEEYIGKKVRIKGDHPHAGETGTVLRFHEFMGIKINALVVKVKDGGEFAVFDTNNLQILK